MNPGKTKNAAPETGAPAPAPPGAGLYAKKGWLALAALAACAAALYFSGVFSWLDFQAIQAERDYFAAFTRRHFGQALAAFCAVYVLCLVLCVPAGTVFGLLAGYLFGIWIGAAAVVFSSTLGGTILFLLAKTSFGALLRRKMGGFYDKIAGNMRENAVSYMLFMRLVPVFPYVVVNILPALFNIPLRLFLATSVIGMLPGVFVLVNLGRALAEIRGPSDLFSPGLLLAFTLLGLLALTPALYRKLARGAGFARGRGSRLA